MRTGTVLAVGVVVAALGGTAALAGSVVWAHGRERPHAWGHGPFGMWHHAHDSLRQLDLTDDQQAQIKGVLRSHANEFHEILDRLEAEHETVREMSDQETVDEAAIRDRVRQAADPLGDLAVLHARAHQEIATILTPEQRQKAKTLRQEMRSQMQEMRKSMHQLGTDWLEGRH
jgi:Spy/CpxP family protein refolding chaperone